MFSCFKKKKVSFFKLHLGCTMMPITQINYFISYIDVYDKFRAREIKVRHDILHVNSSGNTNITYNNNRVSISLAPTSMDVLRQCMFLQVLVSESNLIECLFSVECLFSISILF